MKHLPSYLTAVCYDFKMLLKDDPYKVIVINSLKYLVDVGQINIYGYVIMDNHFILFGMQSIQKQMNNYNEVY